MAEPTVTQPPVATPVPAPASTLTSGPLVSGTLIQEGFPVLPEGMRAQLPSPPDGYELLGILGEGGMGIVYKARQTSLNRIVALKVLLGNAPVSPREFIRFRAEAEAVAAIRHPAVVQVYESGEHAGRPFLAMEYLPGGDLANALKSMSRQEQGYYRKAAQLVAKIAAGVNAAHEQGIVHRDLKPANVMLDASGEPKVTDFGIAKRDTGADLTKTNAVMGTSAYMSPEQAKGNTKFVGPQSDVWSLGVMLYEMLTGMKPFRGETDWEIQSAVIQGTFVRPRHLNPETPKDLELIGLKCLSPEPPGRYTDAGALAADLANWLEGKPIVARAAGTIETAVKWVKRNKAVSGATLAVAAALILGTAISIWQAGLARSEADRADREAQLAKVAQADADVKADLAEQEAANAKTQAKRADVQTMLAETEAANAKAQAKRADTIREFTTNLFKSSDPTGLTGIGLLPVSKRSRSQTVSEMLIRGSATFADKFLDDPLTRAALLDTIGEVNRSVGNRELAKKQAEEALLLREKLLPPDHHDIASSRFHVANCEAESGNSPQAIRLYQNLVDQHARLGTLETREGAEVQLRLSITLIAIGDPEGEDYARKALISRERIHGKTHRETDAARVVLATSLLDLNRPDEATPLILQSLQSIARQPEATEDAVIQAGLELQKAMILYKVAPSLSVAGFKKAMDLFEGAVGSEYMYLALFKFQYGVALRQVGRDKEAEEQFQNAYTIARKSPGMGHPRSAKLHAGYCNMLWSQDRKVEAWKLIQEASEAAERQFPKEARWRLYITCLHGEYAGMSGRLDAASRDSDDALEMLRGLKRPMTHNESDFLLALGYGIGRSGDLKSLRRHFAKLFELDGAILIDQFRKENLLYYAATLSEHGAFAEAEEALVKAFGMPGNPDRGLVAFARGKLAACQWYRGKFQDAERGFREALSEAKAASIPAAIADATMDMLQFLILRQRWSEAPKLAMQLVSVSGHKMINRSWADFILAATAALSPVPQRDNTDLIQVEKRFGKSTESDVVMYRARTVLVLGGDMKREYERLKDALATDPKSDAIQLTIAAYDLVLGDYAKVLEMYNRFKFASSSIHHRKQQLLVAFAAERIASNEKTKASLESELAAAEKYLNDTDQFKDPNIGGYAVSQVLELHWWCRKIRNEVAAQKIIESARRLGSRAAHSSGFLLNFW